MKRRVARDLEYQAKMGHDRGFLAGFPPMIPGPGIKRGAKRRINRLERREAKKEISNDRSD